MIAALAAGPWPDLPATSLFWRVPLVLVGLALSWRPIGRLRVAAVTLAFAALALDLALPAAVAPAVWAGRAGARVAEMQQRLATVADRPALRLALAAGGGEAAPEAPFDELHRAEAELRLPVDALVLVDERSEPVAWTGVRAQTPSRLRLVGERTVAAEPGVQEAWLWWREPILDGGRTIGELLAGVVIPEGGARTALGITAGRAAMVRPRWEGGAAVVSPSGGRLFGVEIVPGPIAPWSAAGGAAVILALLLAPAVTGAKRALLICLAAIVILGADAPIHWRSVAVLFGAAALIGWVATWWLDGSRSGRVRPVWPISVLSALAVALLIWQAQDALLGFPGPLTPERLLAPLPWQVLVVVALTLVFVAAPPLALPLPWAVHALGWLPLVGGLVLADPRLLVVGAAIVALVGRSKASLVLPALAAAVIVVGSDDAARRSALTAGVESTLARMEGEERLAGALLTSVPASGLAELIRLSPPERVVVLGRLAGWLGFSETVPGASLALFDAQHDQAAVWGQSFAGWEIPPRELAGRDLASGWRVAVLAARPPYDVLAALASTGVEAPMAAFDRAGAPISRGATFRPLAPDRVGRALASGRSWGGVSVGERRYSAYLRAYHSWILAVPWVRSPLPELGLSIAGLALWGVLPIVAWRQRRRPPELWRQRRTFAGRMRALSALVTLLPLLLLAELLPLQWARQQQRARLELGRALSQPLAAVGVEQQLPWLARDLGATVALYRGGRIAWCSRPDQVAAGEVPWLAPAEAFIRAVRGWREPLVMGDARVSVFAPTADVAQPEVGAVLGLQVGAVATPYSPREWFVITGIWAAVLALTMSERVGARLARPLRLLVHATRRLERGESVAGLSVDGDEEVVELSQAFETMATTVRRREEELRRQRDLLESVLGTLSAAVLVLEAGGDCGLANASARRLVGERDELAKLRERFGTAIDAMLSRAADGETAVETLRSPAWPEALWQVTVMPLRGMTARRLVVIEDLSEVARAERLASLAELARIVAHEVKNPLTPIRLWAEELQAALEGGTERLTAVATTAAAQILDRVAQLREVAQGFSNLVALEHWERQPMALDEVAREVAAEYEVVATRGITVRLEGERGVVVDADPAWVRRAIRHLIDNSVRAIGASGGTVLLMVSRRDSAATLTVHDSGGGVADANLGRLFEPHFSTTSEGSGLGLAVVRRVMERAGGHAEARNVGPGLEVRLVFPAPAAGDGTV